MSRHLPLALLLSALLLPACDDGGKDNKGPNIDCGTATVPTFSEVAALANCSACHNSALTGASRGSIPAGINYDNYAEAKASATRGMDAIYAGTMPPSGSSPLSADQKTQFYNWASCDTPQ